LTRLSSHPNPTLLVFIGTRPEAIKLAPVILALRAQAGLTIRVCTTGQHRELLAQGLRAFAIAPDHALPWQPPGSALPQVTGTILAGAGRIIAETQPDWVLVQGDTASALACALAAYQVGVPVAHIEAGLRSGDPAEPWPEETQRRLISLLASLHFAPTERARQHLLAEGVAAERILLTGNTVIDALHLACRHPDAQPERATSWPSGIHHRILVTLHRRENHGLRLHSVAQALTTLARRPDYGLIIMSHPNPALAPLLAELPTDRPNLHILPPLDYLPFVALMRSASLILTDSGGIQEEASSLGIPVLILRQRTERQEAIEDGTAGLVGTDSTAIAHFAGQLLDDPAALAAMAHPSGAFGDGHAATRIAEALAARCRGAEHAA